MATGHYRNGILLAPVTADEVVRLLAAADGRCDRRAPGRSPRFRPGRFGPGRGPARGDRPPGRPVSASRSTGSRGTGPAGLTVAELVARWCPSPRGIAVARNGEVVPRSAWAGTVVADGDRIEIVTAAAGG